jgi:thiamine biosynthesis protein ThiS
VTVNGKAREVESLNGELELPVLLERFGVNPRLVAVAINGDVVPKSDYAAAIVREDDTVEIVRMVGGG